MDQAESFPALDTAAIESAIEQIAGGTLSKDIAPQYGITPRALRHRLAKHPEYEKAVIDQTDSIVEDAVYYAITCSDKDDAPIARVRVDTAFKYARARNPAVYGDKVQVTGTIDLRAALLQAYDSRALGATLGATDIDGECKDVDNQ